MKKEAKNASLAWSSLLRKHDSAILFSRGFLAGLVVKGFFVLGSVA